MGSDVQRASHLGGDIPRLIVSALIGLIVALLLTLLPAYLEAKIAATWVMALTRIYNVTEWQEAEAEGEALAARAKIGAVYVSRERAF